MTGYDEERIAAFLRLLPPPPEGWVKAAQELPQARAEADAAFREQLIADLETALEAEGYERHPAVLAALRMRFKSK